MRLREVMVRADLHMIVKHWNGTAWNELPNTSDPPPLPDSYILSSDVTVFDGQPVVAFTRDGAMTVKWYVR